MNAHSRMKRSSFFLNELPSLPMKCLFFDLPWQWSDYVLDFRLHIARYVRLEGLSLYLPWLGHEFEVNVIRNLNQISILLHQPWLRPD